VNRICCLVGAAALAVAATGQTGEPEPDLFEWIEQNVFKKILVTGNQRFLLRLHKIEGNEEAFNEQWNRGRTGNFIDERSVSISGKNVLGVLNFDVQFDNNPYRMPMERRVSVNYNRDWLKLDVGDINARLPSNNDLVRFSRSMSGAQMTTTFGPLSISTLYTQSRSAARTISITGNNTPGPYYLQAGMIVDGSLRVQVDGEDKRLGIDYTVNIYGGTITFEYPIPPTSTIVCTYETMGQNQSRGDVYGGHVAYKISPTLTVGATHIEQKPRSATGLVTTTEAFQGYGAPNTPYFLLNPPLRTQPIIVTVDGVLQVEGVDYFFDEFNPQVFYFTRFMPPTSLIRVTYTPAPDPGSFGNGKRQVSGIDLNWRLGNSQQLSVAAAQSKLYTPTGVQTGQAKSVRYTLDHGRLSLNARWMDIPSNYVTVETTGFGRNTRGIETKVNYQAGDGWNFGLNAQQIEIGTPRYTGEGLETIKGENRDLRFTASRSKSDSDSIYFTALTSDGAYNGIKNQTHGVQSGYKWRSGNFSFDAGIGATQVRAPSDGNANAPLASTSLYGGRFSAAYRASDTLNFSAGIGLNAIESKDKSGFGHDLSLRTEWIPNPKLRMELVLADSDSGAITGIGGYTGGYGFGYNGNGFTGGGTGFNFGSSRGNSRLAQLRTSWNPSNAFSLDLNLMRTEANGDNLSNSNLTGVSLFASWTPSLATRLTTRVEHMQVSFTNQPGTSNNLIYGISLEQELFKKLRFVGDYSFVSSGGTGITGFSRDVNSLFASLTYSLDRRQRAFVEFRKGNVTGYLPDRESYFGLGYSYDILPGIALRSTYKFREREAMGGAGNNASYRSQGLDFELEFRFGGR